MKPSTTTMTIGTLYFIRSLQVDGYKIGITRNWCRRSRELEVGAKSTVILVETVPLPEALELTLHRRFRKERIPQTEYFNLSATQAEDVKAVIAKESQKLKGDQADQHITLARLVYEQESLPPHQVQGHAEEIHRLKRLLDPDYRRSLERAEERAREKKAAEEARERQLAAQQELEAKRKEEERYLSAEKTMAMSRTDVLRRDFGLIVFIGSFFGFFLLFPVVLTGGAVNSAVGACRAQAAFPEECDRQRISINIISMLFSPVLGTGLAACLLLREAQSDRKNAREVIEKRRAAIEKRRAAIAADVFLPPSQAGVSFLRRKS